MFIEQSQDELLHQLQKRFPENAARQKYDQMIQHSLYCAKSIMAKNFVPKDPLLGMVIQNAFLKYNTIMLSQDDYEKEQKRLHNLPQEIGTMQQLQKNEREKGLDLQMSSFFTFRLSESLRKPYYQFSLHNADSFRLMIDIESGKDVFPEEFNKKLDSVSLNETEKDKKIEKRVNTSTYVPLSDGSYFYDREYIRNTSKIMPQTAEDARKNGLRGDIANEILRDLIIHVLYRHKEVLGSERGVSRNFEANVQTLLESGKRFATKIPDTSTWPSRLC